MYEKTAILLRFMCFVYFLLGKNRVTKKLMFLPFFTAFVALKL